MKKLEKRFDSLDSLSPFRILVSCCLLFSCGILTNKKVEKNPHKLVDKYQFENAREWTPRFVNSEDSLSGLSVNFVSDYPEDFNFIQRIYSPDLFTLWHYPLDTSLKSYTRKEIPSLPMAKKPRKVRYKFYEIRGDPIKPKKSNAIGKNSFTVLSGTYLVLFEAFTFQQDLIKNVEVRKGQISVLEVNARREPINVY